MSGRVYLRLKANGEQIKGESSVNTIGGEDVSELIECDSYAEGCKTAQEAGSMTPTGTRLYTPLVIRKNVDASSPLIMRALTDTEPCEAEFLFFRPTKGSGKQEKFFTVTISDARVCEVQRFLPESPLDVSAAGKPPQEQVSFVFGKISWKHEAGKTEHDDLWQEQ
jgi:type VI secretion system secreted protein Hcp